MQENKLISTIKTLYSVGQLEAIIALANDLKTAHEFALSLLDSEAVKEIEATSNPVEPSEPKPDKDTSSYSYFSSEWPLVKKYLYILKTEKRFLHFREAAKILISLEGKGDETLITRALSNSAREIKQEKTIVKVMHESSQKKTFWGSPKWLDAKGKIKDEYMYRTDIFKKELTDSKQSYLFEL